MVEMIMKTPDSLMQLKHCLREADKNTYLISGGTDLIIKIRQKKIHAKTIIDLTGIEELKYIRVIDENICIGSNTTFTEIIKSDILGAHCKCLVEAAGQVGSTQIRNTATIGGNVANAFAGADAIPALMVLDTRIKIMNSRGEVSVKALDDLVLGLGKNSLEFDEVILEIQIPMPLENCITAFGKVGSRTRVTIAKLNMAIKLTIDSGKILDAEVVLGALGPKAFRSLLAEGVLKGRRLDEQLKADLHIALAEQVDISIAGRSSRPYKSEAIKGLADEVIDKLLKYDSGKWVIL